MDNAVSKEQCQRLSYDICPPVDSKTEDLL